MDLYKRLTTSLTAALLGAAVAALPATAADYPSERIEWLVGFSAGGGTDLVSRKIALAMEDDLGEPITIVNKPGAGGLVALQELASRAPDGYTLATFVSNNMLIQRHFKEIVNYIEPLQDLTIVGMVNADYWGIAVPADAPYDDLAGFIRHLEENPGAKVSDGGPGSAYHWGWRTFMDVTGTETRTVTYGGTSNALKALAGGELTAASTALAEATPLVDAGLIKLIGVAAPERYEQFPEVATFREQGVDMVYGPTRGIAAPAGLPQDKLEVLAASVREAFNSESYQDFLKSSGYSGFYLPPEEAAAFVSDQEQSLMTLMKKAGVLRQ